MSLFLVLPPEEGVLFVARESLDGSDLTHPRDGEGQDTHREIKPQDAVVA